MPKEPRPEEAGNEIEDLERDEQEFNVPEEDTVLEREGGVALPNPDSPNSN